MEADDTLKNLLEKWLDKYPDKFDHLDNIFSHIHRGDRIYISSGCGEPQYLVNSLKDYVSKNPDAFYDTEVYHIWTLGVAPYAEERFKDHFRQNSFFIGNNTREAINKGYADYTPIFLSKVPLLFKRKLVTIDIALIQTSIPDSNGYLSLGISVDITKAAIENADLVIAQINNKMPYISGEALISIEKVDYIVPYDEPLLEYEPKVTGEVAARVGNYLAQIVEDGDTLQIGYGSLPNAILFYLRDKKNLGLHSELLSDNVVKLMKEGVINNSHKTLDKGKSIAAFCLGKSSSYEYLNNNPNIEFKPVDYTNNQLIIAKQNNMVSINSALQIDLTGQVNAESIGGYYYAGIGGAADFMRGAALAPNGKSIIVMESTAEQGKVSRIVPVLEKGNAVTLTRGDVYYIITEYGIAYLFGKNTRERAMDLIAIAHPDFRSQLIEQAKELGLIYKDQAFIPGKGGIYPAPLETYRTTRDGMRILLRPVRINDEHRIKDFLYSLSDKSIYRRFIAMRRHLPHDLLQKFVIIDYSKEMVILAVKPGLEKEEILGCAQYVIDDTTHYGDFAIVIRDDCQGKGIGVELLSYLTQIAKRQGLHGFTADVLTDNRPMLGLLKRMNYPMKMQSEMGVYGIRIDFSSQ